MTRSWPPFLSPGWLCAYTVGAALWAGLFAVAGSPGVYVLLAVGVLLVASLEGSGPWRSL